MKHFVCKTCGVWLISVWLLLLYATNRPLFQAFIDSGAQWSFCVDWDENGHVIEGVCEDPQPQAPVAIRMRGSLQR